MPEVQGAEFAIDRAEDARAPVEVDALGPQLGVDHGAVAALDEDGQAALDLPRAQPVGRFAQVDVGDLVPAQRARAQQAADEHAVGAGVDAHAEDPPGADQPDRGQHGDHDPDAGAGEPELAGGAPAK